MAFVKLSLAGAWPKQAEQTTEQSKPSQYGHAVLVCFGELPFFKENIEPV